MIRLLLLSQMSPSLGQYNANHINHDAADKKYNPVHVYTHEDKIGFVGHTNKVTVGNDYIMATQMVHDGAPMGFKDWPRENESTESTSNTWQSSIDSFTIFNGSQTYGMTTTTTTTTTTTAGATTTTDAASNDTTTTAAVSSDSTTTTAASSVETATTTVSGNTTDLTTVAPSDLSTISSSLTSSTSVDDAAVATCADKIMFHNIYQLSARKFFMDADSSLAASPNCLATGPPAGYTKCITHQEPIISALAFEPDCIKAYNSSIGVFEKAASRRTLAVSARRLASIDFERTDTLEAAMTGSIPADLKDTLDKRSTATTTKDAFATVFQNMLATGPDLTDLGLPGTAAQVVQGDLAATTLVIPPALATAMRQSYNTSNADFAVSATAAVEGSFVTASSSTSGAIGPAASLISGAVALFILA